MTMFSKIFQSIRRHCIFLDNPQHNLSLWGIAWMSFFLSTSSLIAFSILPTFMTEVLHISKTKLGFIEGVAIFTAFAAKVFSGVSSDYFKNRKPLIIIGTCFSILIKPMFAIASTVGMIFAAHFIDRLSKGIRSAPTDALIADLSPKDRRGISYGMRQSLYTFGGMFGAFLAFILIWGTDHDYRLIFMFSMIPAVLALIVLCVVVKQPPISENGRKVDWNLKDIKLLPKRYWWLLFIVFFLMMSRFSTSFIVLRAREVGWSVASLPLIHVLMDLVHASMAFPMGRLSDRFNRYHMFILGLIITCVAHITMIFATHPGMVCMGIVCVGVYLGIMQGLMATLISDATPAHLRGTAFAMYYLTAGTSVLIGNVLAGSLSDQMGLIGAFLGGLTVTLLAIIGVLIMMRVLKLHTPPSA